MAPASNKSKRLLEYRPRNRADRDSDGVRRAVKSLVRVGMFFNVLETELETELNGAGAMRINRVQERCPSDAIGPAPFKTGGIHRAGIATDHIVSAAARVVGVIGPELSVIEKVEGLGTELEFAGLPDFEMLQHGHVEVQAAGIIQEVPACIAEGESARSNELGRIAQEWAKAS